MKATNSTSKKIILSNHLLKSIANSKKMAQVPILDYNLQIDMNYQSNYSIDCIDYKMGLTINIRYNFYKDQSHKIRNYNLSHNPDFSNICHITSSHNIQQLHNLSHVGEDNTFYLAAVYLTIFIHIETITANIEITCRTCHLHTIFFNPLQTYITTKTRMRSFHTCQIMIFWAFETLCR